MRAGAVVLPARSAFDPAKGSSRLAAQQRQPPSWWPTSRRFIRTARRGRRPSASDLVGFIDELLCALKRHSECLSYVPQRQALVMQPPGGLP